MPVDAHGGTPEFSVIALGNSAPRTQLQFDIDLMFVTRARARLRRASLTAKEFFKLAAAA